MAETYCGKHCDLCGFRETLACPGCKAGPGRIFGGDCKQAQCCRERGHETCETCNQKGLCGKYREAGQLPEYRLEKQKREQAVRRWMEKQMPMMAKCFTLIFWIAIAANIPAILGGDFTKSLPGLHLTGQVLGLLLSLTTTGCYFLLRKVNIRYQKAAFFIGLAVLADFAFALTSGNEALAWVQLVRIPGIVLGIVGKYHLYNAHSEILVSQDYDLSEKWMRLWKWYVRIMIAMAAALVLALILPLLALVAVALLGIGSFVLSILELIYLYCMGAHFRSYARELKSQPQET